MIRLGGSARPSALSAARTRSRISPTALSGSPTTVNATMPPEEIWTWTSMSITSMPWKATVLTRATIGCACSSSRRGTSLRERTDREQQESDARPMEDSTAARCWPAKARLSEHPIGRLMRGRTRPFSAAVFCRASAFGGRLPAAAILPTRFTRRAGRSADAVRYHCTMKALKPRGRSARGDSGGPRRGPARRSAPCPTRPARPAPPQRRRDSDAGSPPRRSLPRPAPRARR